jgi:hypothetical protein
MSSILYYSNFCDHSKKLLQTLSKTQVSKDIHFICIDKRVRGEDGKVHIVLENGQKIVMPENVNRVPALLLLNQGYNVLYGDSILEHFRPVQQKMVKQATQNNMEPLSFSFENGGFGNVVSDQYSFLDMDSGSLSATGTGGLRQMHNYIGYGDSFSITTPVDEYDYKASKLPEDLTIDQLQQQRASEVSNIKYNVKK